MVRRWTFCTALAALALSSCSASLVCAEVLSAKRGFADTGANYYNLQATGAGWYYTWGTGIGNPGNFDANHYPMFWNAPSQNTINNVKSRNPNYVLGFNEPERGDQANMTVAQAISSWTAISNAFTGTNTKLVSPAVADTGGANGGQAWLASFMQQAAANNLKVDAVAFHWYGVSTPDNPAGAASSFLSRVDSYHNSYNKPVFITEFAIHDWGGNYTDEEISEANRQFLNIVIPALESRSYVAGYSWYHWFSDAPLYTPPNGSSNLTPTPMAYSYVGAVTTGQTANIAGQNLGEHVAYLAGGELTQEGASVGTLRYINALANTSTISGSSDWGLSGRNLVRIQPNATLRKSGSNEITISGVITNNGSLDVAQGTLRIGSPTAGNGTISVSGGTLTLYGAGQINSAPVIDVFGGGTLDASALTQWNIVGGQTLDNEHNGTVVGNVVAASGATVAGGGTFANNLIAFSGSTIRVGTAGLSLPSWTPIDDFESYAPGKLVDGATGGVWTGVLDGTANAQVVSAGRNRSLEFYGTGNSWRGARTSLRSSFSPDDHALEDGDTATYFFRVQRQGTQTLDGVFGLTDQDSIGIDSPWAELATTLSLFQGTGPGDTTALRAYDSDSGVDVIVRNDIGANQWTNVWLVVDNANKTYEVATSTGTDDGVLFPNTFNFGRQTAIGAALDTFAGAEFRSGSNPANASVRVDDLVYLAGENITNPLSGAAPSVLVEPAVLRVEGDFRGSEGSTLEIDLYDPTAFDRLEVTGELTAGGLLHVSLDADAPAPEAGDEFDILDFGSLTGIFDSVELPALVSGLVWDNSQLLSDGILAVAAGVAGDYNDDGRVDAADYVSWRSSLGQVGAGLAADGNGDLHVNQADYEVWRLNVGTTLGGNSASGSLSAVPQPNSLLLTAIAVMVVFSGRAKVPR
jgi:hypothetical protein